MENYIFTYPEGYEQQDIEHIISNNEEAFKPFLATVNKEQHDLAVFLYDRIIRYVMSEKKYANDVRLAVIILPIAMRLIRTVHENPEFKPLPFEVERFVDFVGSKKEEYTKSIADKYNTDPVVREEEGKYCEMVASQYIDHVMELERLTRATGRQGYGVDYETNVENKQELN